MKRVEPGDLAAFLAVIVAGSFTKLAARRAISQSALSHAVQRMEAHLGLRLVNRTTDPANISLRLAMLATIKPGSQLLSHDLTGSWQIRILPQAQTFDGHPKGKAHLGEQLPGGLNILLGTKHVRRVLQGDGVGPMQLFGRQRVNAALIHGRDFEGDWVQMRQARVDIGRGFLDDDMVALHPSDEPERPGSQRSAGRVSGSNGFPVHVLAI